MSDYSVYIKCESEDIEIEIPDIYKDSCSETNSDQIKRFLADKYDIDFTELSCDIKRNKRLKRNCTDYEILDGDELHFYFIDINNEIDITKLKLRSGYYNVLDEGYHKHNFTEVDLQIILSIDDIHREKIEELLKIFRQFLLTVTSDQDIAFISCLTLLSFNNLHIKSFPFNVLGEDWYFGFINSSGLPCGYGYYFSHSTKTYYEGNFSENNIYNGKSLFINGDTSYYTTGDFYSFFKQNNRGLKKYIFRNETYIGSFKNNEYCNGGKLITDKGEYNGLFSEGKKNGYGMMIYKNNDQYLGFWSNDLRSNFGKMKYSSGDYYSGTWEEDKKEVFGTYFDSECRITYVGTFFNDKRTFINDEFRLISGNVFFTDQVGEYDFSIKKEDLSSFRKTTVTSIYEYTKLMPASFKSEVISRLDSSKQTFYIGHFDHIRQFYGMGKLYYNYGNELINNEICSSIPIHSSKHEKIKFSGYRSYHSLFENGYPNGFGMINYENGDKYIGSITNGQINGEGIFIRSTGKRIKALWYNGLIVDKKYETVV